LKSYDVSIKINRSRLLPEIQADPEQLKEAMINIIVNACEAIKKGGLIIVNEKQAFSKTFGKVAEIRLSDNGPGIPEAIIDKVLQPFFTTKVEGTGLGLSIAARIVEEHGGQLAVASREGQGTTFIITLPVKEMSVEHHSHY
jgi:signal transduction histidine kinase